MECRDLAQQLDDLLDGGLDALQRKAIQEHLGSCPDCRRRHEHAVAARQAGPELSPPALHPGFIDHALSRATRVCGARPGWRPMLRMALAARLALGVAPGVVFGTQAN